MADTSLDPELAVYQKIWQLLINNIDWAAMFPAKRRIRYDAADKSDPEKPRLHEGDFPQAHIYPFGGQTDLRTTGETFQTHTDMGCPWIENQNYDFRLVMTSQLMGIGEVFQSHKLTAKAIRAGGATLGLGYVTAVRLRWTNERITDPEKDGLIRWRTTMIIAVGCEIPSSMIT